MRNSSQHISGRDCRCGMKYLEINVVLLEGMLRQEVTVYSVNGKLLSYIFCLFFYSFKKVIYKIV